MARPHRRTVFSSPLAVHCHLVRTFLESAGIPAEAARASIAEPLFWSLALGACLGGNGTLIGASANIIMSRIGEKNNIPIRFRTFLAYGVPFTVLALVISSVYIYLRYFLWAGK